MGIVKILQTVEWLGEQGRRQKWLETVVCGLFTSAATTGIDLLVDARIDDFHQRPNFHEMVLCFLQEATAALATFFPDGHKRTYTDIMQALKKKRV